MGHFVDRRLNPKDKSLGNRRRFLKRVRSHIKKSVDDAVRERGIADADRGEKVVVPSGSIEEPSFRHAAREGQREHASTGNKSFNTGDKIKKPAAGGAGGGGRRLPMVAMARTSSCLSCRARNSSICSSRTWNCPTW